MSKEAMTLALEALKELNEENSYWWQEVDESTLKKLTNAEKALEETLANQEGQSNFCPNCETLARELKAIKQEQINSTTSMSLTSQDGAEQEQDMPKIGCVNHDCDKCKKQKQGKPVGWPCLIAEANFSQDTVTLAMQCTDYKVSAGKHWLCTTPQPAQKPLTDEQIDATPWIGGLNRDSVRRFARAIEAAHGIKENT